MTHGPVLTVNVGSSSIKLSTVDSNETVTWTAALPAPGDGGLATMGALLADLLGGVGEINAVGHRFVHGGTLFRGPTLVAGVVVHQLAELADLAPLHQRRSLAALEIVSELFPAALPVACFDTAFHHTLRPAAACYPLPAAWRAQFGLRRYGFHGLSHAHAVRHAPSLLNGAPARRTVVCHLGAGASLAAVLGGRCVDTTMGFTPADGLMQATRCGAVDPGLLLWLLDDDRVPLDQLFDGVHRRGGLMALAGTADMAEVLRARARGDRDAEFAIEVYLHRLIAGIAQMVAALGGLDVLVFTGGIGENATELRALTLRRLGWLGLSLDEHHNARTRAGAEGVISAGPGPRSIVIVAREDLEIARQVRALRNTAGSPEIDLSGSSA